MSLKKLTLGSVVLPNNIMYAPLAGCSDFPFRRMSARWGPGLMYCEMVKMDALIRNDQNTFHLLDYMAAMRPIGAQLCGSKPRIAGQAAKILEELGFDVIDLNCGCPVDKVTKDGSGSGMLKNPELIGEVLSEIVAAVSVPVTVKIRAGWDSKILNAPQITQIAEKAGAKAITIHGRTREQGYRGDADWEQIRLCKEVANEIQVIGNGDVFTAEAAQAMFQRTGCDGVLVSRGTMGQPWIVEDTIDLLTGKPPKLRDEEFCRQALLDHFRYVCEYHPPRKVLIEMRRIACWYIKKTHGTKHFRQQISGAKSLEEVEQLIHEFAFEV